MIDPNDAPAGYIAIVSEDGCCDGCAFRGTATCETPHDCTYQGRKDELDVIFIKIKPESSLPEDI